MRKKRILGIFMILIMVFSLFSLNTKAKDELPPDIPYYQVMRYCPGSVYLKLACTSAVYPKSCRQYYCITAS